MLELVEAALDHVAQSIEEAVDWLLDFAVALKRDDGFNPAIFEVLAYGVAVIALVGQHHFGAGAGLIHQRAIAFHVRRFARR